MGNTLKECITPRLLLQHRAGVFDLAGDQVPATVAAPFAGAVYLDWEMSADADHTFTLDEQAGILAKYNLYSALPGEDFHYSNTGYSLLAAIVERASGKSFAAFVREEFLIPLGLERTSFPESGTDKLPPLPFIVGNHKKNGQFVEIRDNNVSCGIGSYNIITTLPELARFLGALLKGETRVDPAAVRKMYDFKPSDMPGVVYGLALMNAPTDLGFGLNGNMRGYHTIARSDPAKGVTVVIFSSLTDADSPSKVLPVLRRSAIEAKKLLGY